MASNSSGNNTRTPAQGLDKGNANQKAAGGTKDTMAKPQQGDSTAPGAPATPASQTTVNVNSGTAQAKPAPTVGQNNASLRNNPQSGDDADM